PLRLRGQFTPYLVGATAPPLEMLDCALVHGARQLAHDPPHPPDPGLRLAPRLPEAGTGARRFRGRRPHGSARRLDRPPAGKPEPPRRVPRPGGRQAPPHGVLRDTHLSPGPPVVDR